MNEEPALFRFGSAQKIITPPLGVYLAGFFHERIAKNVRDDLYVKAVVIENNTGRLAFVSLDLVCVDDDLVSKSKRFVEKRCGMRFENVLICGTHTHTGPEIRREGNWGPRDDEWVAGLPKKIADTVQEAAEGVVEGTLHPAVCPTQGYVFNRIFRLKDGSEKMGSGQGSDMLGPAGPVDNGIYNLSMFDREGRMRGMIVNIGMHTNVVGGGSADFISADYPAEIAKTLTSVYGQDTVSLFLLGSCGDTHHEPYEESYLPQSGDEKCKKLGRGLAGAAMYCAEKAEPMEENFLYSKMISLDIPYYSRTQEIMEELEEYKEKAERTPYEDVFINAVENWPYDGKTAKVPVQIVVIGDLAIVALPFQIFTQYALDMKHWSPFPLTMVVELANARVSNYVSTTDQVNRGAYGTIPIISRWLCEDAGRIVSDAVQVHLTAIGENIQNTSGEQGEQNRQ